MRAVDETHVLNTDSETDAKIQRHRSSLHFLPSFLPSSSHASCHVEPPHHVKNLITTRASTLYRLLFPLQCLAPPAPAPAPVTGLSPTGLAFLRQSSAPRSLSRCSWFAVCGLEDEGPRPAPAPAPAAAADIAPDKDEVDCVAPWCAPRPPPLGLRAGL